MMLVLRGKIVKTRSLGKGLRFADIQIESSEFESKCQGQEEKLLSERERNVCKNDLVPPGKIVEVAMRRQDWIDQDEFPHRRSDLLCADIALLRVCKIEQVEGVNGNEDKFLFRCISCKLLERPPRDQRTTWHSGVKSLTSQSKEERPVKDFDDAKAPKRQRFTTPHTTYPPLCKHWIYDIEGCKGAFCGFRHFVLNMREEERIDRLRLQRNRISLDAALHSEEYREGHSCGDLACKQARATVFAQWLISVFGEDDLAQGSGVLDIAGGKGLNSIKLLLTCKNPKLMATVVDPFQRSTTISKKHSKELKKIKSKPPDFMFVTFDEAFVKENEKLVSNSSCILGMHPDQATGDIVRFAVMYKRPFAVVPCCVFAGQFAERKTKDGKDVETVNDLVQWLCLFHKNIKTDFLPVSGRNKVLFMRKEDYETENQ